MSFQSALGLVLLARRLCIDPVSAAWEVHSILTLSHLEKSGVWVLVSVLFRGEAFLGWGHR